MYVELFLLDKLDDEFFVNSAVFVDWSLCTADSRRQLLLYCLAVQYKPESKTNARGSTISSLPPDTLERVYTLPWITSGKLMDYPRGACGPRHREELF